MPIYHRRKITGIIKKQVHNKKIINSQFTSFIESDDKPKEEPMDTSDAQVSLGSDGILESNPTSALATEPTSVSEKPTKVSSPTQNKISVSILSFTIQKMFQSNM